MKNWYHFIIAIIANIVLGFPARQFIVIGVTGTDGKTTTANLIYHILKSAGKNVSLISTTGAILANKQYPVGFHVTTPSSWKLLTFIKKAVSNSSEKKYLVLEVTSHAIDQNRIAGIQFNYAVLTNITHEHLDYHKTYKKYALTKIRLLKKAKVALVNKDDQSYEMVYSHLQNQNKKIITYGLAENADINPRNFQFKTKLIGEFNTANCLSAIALAKQLDISDENIKKAISDFTPPLGRQDVVYKKDFTIMIDFAHTQNGLSQLLSGLRKHAKGRLIHVFGAAGERDFEKRSVMGTVSSQYTDIIVLTSEDPRSEKALDIIKKIESGIKDWESKMKKGTLFEIINREEAIQKAVNLAQKNDIVVITGKGHEESMNYGHGEVPWSEYAAVEKALKNKKYE